MPRWLPIVVVVLVGVSALAGVTDGFRAVTTEGARRLAVERAPRSLPDARMVDHLGVPFGWGAFAGDTVLVEFIFTSCPDVCQTMSAELGALSRVRSERGDDRVRFLSLSFDPEHDTVERLRSMAARHGADGTRWRFARIADRAELEATLDAFGVVALPSPGRGFEHNVALHGVNSQGELSRITDINDGEEMLRWARVESMHE